MDDPLAFGPKYLDNILTILSDANCKAPTYACLYAMHRLMDWKTGRTRGQLAHSTLAKLTGCSFDTVKRHMRALRALGVVKIVIKGNDYDGGEGNTYALAIPGLSRSTQGAEKHGGGREARGAEKHGGGREARTPGAEKPGPPVQRSPPKHSSLLSEGQGPGPSRTGLRPIGAAVAASDIAEPQRSDSIQNENDVFWDRRWKALSRELGCGVQALAQVDTERKEAACAAAMNEGGGQNFGT
jgi:hypothetical protein